MVSELAIIDMGIQIIVFQNTDATLFYHKNTLSAIFISFFNSTLSIDIVILLETSLGYH